MKLILAGAKIYVQTDLYFENSKLRNVNTKCDIIYTHTLYSTYMNTNFYLDSE